MDLRKIAFVSSLLSLVTFLFVISVDAQAVKTSWHTLEKGAMSNQSIIPDNSGGCFIVGNYLTKQDVVVVKYSADIEEGFRVIVPPKVLRDKMKEEDKNEIQKAFYMDGKLYLFGIYNVSDERVVYVRTVSESGTLNNDYLELGTFKGIGDVPETIQIAVSNDSSKIVVWNSTKGAGLTKKKVFTAVLDITPYKLHSQKTFELPYVGKDIYNTSVAIQNNGSTALTATVSYKKYKPLIYYYDLVSQTTKEFEIQLEDAEFAKPNVYFDDKGELEVFGLFQQKRKEKMVGYYWQKINLQSGIASKQTSKAVFIPRHTSSFSGYGTVSNIKGAEDDFLNYSLLERLTLKNGNTLYTIEYQTLKDLTTLYYFDNSHRGSYEKDYFHINGSVHSLEINNGELVTYGAIDKYEYGSFGEGQSIGLLQEDSSVYFIFNKNNTPISMDVLQPQQPQFISDIQFGKLENGRFDIKNLFSDDSHDRKTIVFPLRTVALGNKKFLTIALDVQNNNNVFESVASKVLLIEFE